ncbi:hypothetical protein BCR32DRAFT_330176 [Anaeromyces robustus]|uniref:G-protein coupled receptors family 1 profile domain-containing protein n=1 Tax=Anaeromyces robustus TaxID=1754192 RepID=A0A1Y1W705_9FUNG|nr:hypothetical protein BCR32DRAFT_330176 [Anaeromyces robustus]|eukprot:ORX69319.1 hypothetical protein BCR32DRAFT_330176 [Anaeromyces robustus]
MNYGNDTIVEFIDNIVKRESNYSSQETIENVQFDNSSTVVANRMGIIVITLSWYFYGKYALLSLLGIKRHKNYNFLFPMTASLFAFVNNTGDLFFFIYRASSCKVFYHIFVGSATLNWAPISWLQAYRLAVISNIYLPKKGFYLVTATTFTLSIVYCTFYFCNLSIFGYQFNPTTGCAVTNPGTYSYYVMVSDIVDSAFAFTAICTLIYRSIKGLKELNTRNQKLNDLVGQGVLELLIITLAKIIIYPLIALTSKLPALDIFWDILSVIVIICGYELVNFPYSNNQNGGKGNGITRNIFTFIETSANYSFSSNTNSKTSRLSSGSLKDTTRSYNKNETTPAQPSTLKTEVV